jgi:hypothetical protein
MEVIGYQRVCWNGNLILPERVAQDVSRGPPHVRPSLDDLPTTHKNQSFLTPQLNGHPELMILYPKDTAPHSI